MKQILYSLIIIVLIGCDPDNYKFEYDIVITNSATNLKQVNSEYDDFNSDLPYDAQRMEIIFSSNRNSFGNDFDIISQKLDFSYHSRDDILNVSIPDDYPSVNFELIFEKINSDGDEFGPYSYFSGEDLLFMYATEIADNFSINLVEYTNWNTAKVSDISDPIMIPIINDLGNNLYPSISKNKKEMFFCSDRNDTSYNLYSALYNSDITKESLLSGDINVIKKDTVLSSSFDDKCPYVEDNIIVFTSNRPDGFGGYDLYYSRYENNSWNEPILFGDKINSEFDEYRPVIFQMLGYNLMIFSSNRPDGKGEFDLYIVKIDEANN